VQQAITVVSCISQSRVLAPRGGEGTSSPDITELACLSLSDSKKGGLLYFNRNIIRVLCLGKLSVRLSP